MKKNPDIKGKQVKIEFGLMWKNMSEKERKPYEDAYQKEKAAYDLKVEKNPDLKGKRTGSKHKAAPLYVEPPKKVIF